MDILFENVFEAKYDEAMEYYKYIYAKRPAMKVLYVLYGFLILLLIAVKITNPEGIPILPYVIVFALLAGFLILNYYIVKRKVLKSAEERIRTEGGPTTAKATFTQDEIITEDYLNENNKSERKITYSQVKHVIRTKHYTYLYSTIGLLFIIKNDAFTRGNIDGLIDFFKSKGIKIKK